MPPRSQLNLDDYDFDLPPELIAQRPLADRSACRLLVVNRATHTLADCRFRDLPSLLRAGDHLVVNDTRVTPARLLGQRASGGRVELLLHRQLGRTHWECLAQPAGRLRVGERLDLGQGLSAAVEGRGGEGLVTVSLRSHQPLARALARVGHVPLPPYIRRADTIRDRRDYQSLFARHPGAVAAPTASLHFTRDLLARLRAGEVRTSAVTLHVGLGTFQPLRPHHLRTGCLHAECYAIPAATAQAIAATRAAGGRIVAVGTTVARTLESVAREHRGRVIAAAGETTLFIRPGFTFRAVDCLLTNFHLPRSSLLLLVSAFAGADLTRAAYAHAIAQRYRFYSYGDAMLIM